MRTRFAAGTSACSVSRTSACENEYCPGTVGRLLDQPVVDRLARGPPRSPRPGGRRRARSPRGGSRARRPRRSAAPRSPPRRAGRGAGRRPRARPAGSRPGAAPSASPSRPSAAISRTTSPMKNGLPPVWSRIASRELGGRALDAGGELDVVGDPLRVEAAQRDPPRALDPGEVAERLGERVVAAELDVAVGADRAAGPVPASRRATKRSSCSEGSSAQCRSSSTITSGRALRGAGEEGRERVEEPEAGLLGLRSSGGSPMSPRRSASSGTIWATSAARLPSCQRSPTGSASST